MEFNYIADTDQQILKRFLKRKGISKKLLAKIKFAGGKIFVNEKEENAIFRVMSGDEIKIITPDEPANPELIAEDFPLKIVYEDEDYLIVDKPAGYPSITGREKPTGAMSNFVAYYLQAQGYPNQKVHIVTRLDRDTSGLMLFAKHSFAHSVLIEHKEDFLKKYFAVIRYDENFPRTGKIDAPIGRKEGSIIERCVRFDGLLEAKAAQTSYETLEVKGDKALLDVRLHTGRTHQIRVHFAYIGYPLIGDGLYGGDTTCLKRQALHCHFITFENLFSGKRVEVESPLAKDIADFLEKWLLL